MLKIVTKIKSVQKVKTLESTPEMSEIIQNYGRGSC